jgi:hypothetical protein
VRQADQVQERQVQAPKPLYVLLPDSASALNASKKSLQFPMMAQEDLAAEEEGVYNFPLSALLTEILK